MVHRFLLTCTLESLGVGRVLGVVVGQGGGLDGHVLGCLHFLREGYTVFVLI